MLLGSVSSLNPKSSNCSEVDPNKLVSAQHNFRPCIQNLWPLLHMCQLLCMSLLLSSLEQGLHNPVQSLFGAIHHTTHQGFAPFSAIDARSRSCGVSRFETAASLWAALLGVL